MLLADLDAAVRVLLHCPHTARAGMAKDLIGQAHTADKYRKRLRKPHPCFGSGTLMSAANKHSRAARPARYDAAAADALAMLLAALASHRAM